MIYQVSPTGTYTQFSELPSLVSGDVVSFEKGFEYNQIILSNETNISFTSYGSGANPVISVMETASSFTDLGSGLWSFPADTNILVIDGSPQKKGRFPKNTDEYYTITANSIVIPQGQPNEGKDYYLDHGTLPFLANGEVVIRLQSFITNTYEVISDTGTIITYPPERGQYPPLLGYGFALQNQIECLTEVGDWMCVGGVITIYLGTQLPTDFIFQYPTQINALDMTSCTGISFDSINFYGGLEDTVSVNNSTSISFTSCNIKYAEGMGVRLIGNSDSPTFISCRADHCFAGGFYGFFNVDNITAINCSAYDIGMIEGGSPLMNYDGRSNGFCFEEGINNLIDNCHAERIGFNAYVFLGNGTIVRNSVAKYFCFEKGDGGGFYTSNPSALNILTTPMEVSGNIALYGVGKTAGTDSTVPNCQGFYSDDNSNNILWTGNLSAFNQTGFYIHNSKSSQYVGNTAYSNFRQLNIVNDSGNNMFGIAYNNNVHVTTSINQEMGFIYGTRANILNFGTFASNTYNNFDTSRPIFGTYDGSEPKPFRYEILPQPYFDLTGETLSTVTNYETLPYEVVSVLNTIDYQTDTPTDFGVPSGVSSVQNASGLTISLPSTTKSEGFIRMLAVTADTWYLVSGEATGDFEEIQQDFETNYDSPANPIKNLKIDSEVFALPIYSDINRTFQQFSLYQEKDFTSITFKNLSKSEITVSRTESLADIVIDELNGTWSIYLDGVIPIESNNEIIILASPIKPLVSLESEIQPSLTLLSRIR
tara:strand:+ start:4714 stop:7008 length:2295 start_codon:yes stop_codon:yes gene_type:complete